MAGYHAWVLTAETVLALEVIGAGFGRTGTLSLKKALETLGVIKCYHMSEVVANPQHADLWLEAWRGADPWDEIFDGYRAAVDWPTAAFWPRLMEFYPDAKIVLSVRDPQSWFRSASDTIFRSMIEGLQADDPVRVERIKMAKTVIVDGTFGGDLEDERRVIEVYEANVARVHATVPADRLIVVDPKRGDAWQPLCDGLGMVVPSVPYPRINTTQEFEERWRGGDPNRSMGTRC